MNEPRANGEQDDRDELVRGGLVTADTEEQAWEGALALGDVLRSAGIVNLDDVLVIRHTLTADGLATPRDLTTAKVIEYTRCQSVRTIKFPKDPPRWWLNFVADGQRRTRLFGAFENRGEVIAERTSEHRFYDLVPANLLASLTDRLVVEWSADMINWSKRGSLAASFPVIEISDPNAVPFPGYDRISLTYEQLQDVVTDGRYDGWRSALGSVQGIYLIADATNGKLYVGKADGGERVLGRWRTYAETGHGGNLGLKEVLSADPGRVEHWRWSLLRVFGSNTTPDVVDEAEAHFKATLLTRAFGYNLN